MAQDQWRDQPSGDGPGIEAADLKERLQEARRQAKRFGKTLFGLGLLLALVACFSFYHFVWRYAAVDNVKMTQDRSDPTSVLFRFTVVSDGFLEYGHGTSMSGEPVSKGDERKFEYGRPVPGSETKFTVFIRCRWAIFPYWYSETFPTKRELLSRLCVEYCFIC